MLDEEKYPLNTQRVHIYQFIYNHSNVNTNSESFGKTKHFGRVVIFLIIIIKLYNYFF